MKKRTKKILIGSSSALLVGLTSTFVISQPILDSSKENLNLNKAISGNVNGPVIISNESTINVFPTTYFYLSNFDANSPERFTQWNNTNQALTEFKKRAENQSLATNSVASEALNSLIEIYENLRVVEFNLNQAARLDGINSQLFQDSFNQKKDEEKFLGVTPIETVNLNVTSARSVFETNDPNAELQILIRSLNGFTINSNSTLSLRGNLNPDANSVPATTPEIVNLANGVPTTPDFVNLGNSTTSGVSTIVEIAEIDELTLSSNRNIILDFSYTGIQNGASTNNFNDAVSLPETTRGKLVLINENGELANATSISSYASNLNVFGRWMPSSTNSVSLENTLARPHFMNNFIIEKVNSTYKIFVSLKPKELISNVSVSQGSAILSKFGILNTQILSTQPLIQNNANAIFTIPFFESNATTQTIPNAPSLGQNQKLDVYLGNGATFTSQGIFIKGLNDNVFTRYDVVAPNAAGGGRIAPNLEIVTSQNNVSSPTITPGNIQVNPTTLGLGSGTEDLKVLDINVSTSIFSQFNFSLQEITFNNNHIAITDQVTDAANSNSRNYNPIYSLVRETEEITNSLISKKIFFRAPFVNSNSVLGNPDQRFPRNLVSATQIENQNQASLVNLSHILNGWISGNPIVNLSFDQDLKVITFTEELNRFTRIRLDQISRETGISGNRIYSSLRNTFENYENLKTQIISGYRKIENNPFNSALGSTAIIDNILQLVPGSVREDSLQLIASADPVSNSSSSRLNYDTVTSNELNKLIIEAYSTLQNRVKSAIDSVYARAISSYLNGDIVNNDEKRIPNLNSMSLSTSTPNGEIPLININRNQSVLSDLPGVVKGNQIFKGIFEWLSSNNLGIGLYSSTTPIINRTAESFSLSQIFEEFRTTDPKLSILSDSAFFGNDLTGNIEVEKALNLYKILFRFFGTDLNTYQANILLNGNQINFSDFENQNTNNISVSRIVRNMYSNLNLQNKTINFDVFGINIKVNSYNALVSAANLKFTLDNIRSLNSNNRALLEAINTQLRENLLDINNLASYSILIDETNLDKFTQDFSNVSTNQSIRSRLENSDIINKPLFVSNSLQSNFGTSINQSAPIVALILFALVGFALISTAGYVLVARKKTITFKNSNKGLKLTLSSMIILGIILLLVIVPIAIIL
ncbi:MMOB1650 family gliding machinery internal complex protein [[Mycoplasma] mobile]|uniref:Expressed protein n=1 Tax=Mycoplasma mobile (strain ATCC 43663 / 163K / NCTC 11711) TaxID=267748 RepID=Q6KIC5_MYCM1|nr:hypothetical protein [[Mycoplasma] mobile]AAT27651.1 expressed protein [Mycoplasma mobile 163K]